MAEADATISDVLLESSLPAAPLESILCTEELHRRPSRAPDHEKENRALVKLVSALADSPATIFQTLAETILDITQCDSAGLSLLTRDGKTPDVCGERFYWPAIAGMFNPHQGGGTPRKARNLPAVNGDRVQLQQVILNLLLNAADAMSDIDDRPRDLVVSTTRDHGDHVRVTVRDVGVGLSPEHTDKIFDAFYTTKSGGMGMGLSVSRSIIERHRGRLWVERTDGPGATFTCSIPLDPTRVPETTHVKRTA